MNHAHSPLDGRFDINPDMHDPLLRLRAQAYRAQGLSTRRIARELGISQTAVVRITTPPEKEPRARATV